MRGLCTPAKTVIADQRSDGPDCSQHSPDSRKHRSDPVKVRRVVNPGRDLPVQAQQRSPMSRLVDRRQMAIPGRISDDDRAGPGEMTSGNGQGQAFLAP